MSGKGQGTKRADRGKQTVSVPLEEYTPIIPIRQPVNRTAIRPRIGTSVSPAQSALSYIENIASKRGELPGSLMAAAEYEGKSIAERVALKNETLRDAIKNTQVEGVSDKVGTPSPAELAGLIAFMTKETPKGPAGGSRKKAYRGGDPPAKKKGAEAANSAKLPALSDQQIQDAEQLAAAVADPPVSEANTAAAAAAAEGATEAQRVAVAEGLTMAAAWQYLKDKGVIAGGELREFVLEELKPIWDQTGPIGEIFKNVLIQSVRVPISLVLLTGAGAGYTANVAAKLLKKLNDSLRGTSAFLLSDEAANAAADAAVESTTATTKTVVVAGLVLNQLSILPASAILAVILVSLQANLGSGVGRAYLMSSVYAWYLGQSVSDRAAINHQATEYYEAAKQVAEPLAKNAAVGARAAAVSGLGKAAKELGKLLAKKANKVDAAAAPDAVVDNGKVFGINPVGKNALEVVASEIATKDAKAEIAAPPVEAKAVEETLVSEAAVSAAAKATSEPDVVAVAESLGAGGTPADAALAAAAAAAKPAARRRKMSGGSMLGGRRKTKKRGPKRRVTRRRKPTRVLGAPVFIY